MLTRRRFLITAATLLGAWPGLDALALALDGTPPALSRASTAMPSGSSIDLEPPASALRTLCVIDERCTPEGFAANAGFSNIVHLDGDAGLLWHRVLQPFVGDASRTRSDSLASIEGWTSHADWFVLSTLVAAHDTAARCTIRGRRGSASSQARHDAAACVAIDSVFWRIDLAA